MTDEIAASGGVPKRGQFPALSYRGYLREKYYYLSQHPERPELHHAYNVVLGALNDSTTDQARDYLRQRLGSESEYDEVYRAALSELDEEERERKARMKQWPERLRRD